MTLPDGRAHAATILDLSPSGAALATAARPPVGSALQVGKVPATAVRPFDDGIAVAFETQQSPDSLAAGLG